MLIKRHIKATTIIIFSVISLFSMAQNRIDRQRPDAPSMAAYGQYMVGVRTLEIQHAEQIDIVKIDADSPKPETLPRYTRPLTLEVWYPAVAGSEGQTTLEVYLRDGETKVRLEGKAIRDAKPLINKEKYPLVLVSHGYPGNRYLLAHLSENLASKGYVVVSIDHTDSTYRTQAAFGSTLVNRSLDQLFTLDEIEKMSKTDTSFLFQLVDTQNSALIGYSMGGYGAIVTAGGGVTQQAVDNPWGAPQKTLDIHKHSSGAPKLADPRLKTVIAFAPWGMNFGVWDQVGLQNIKIPLLLISGSEDDVSGYEKGVRAIWQGATNTKRALLTFDNANHNAGAPIPAPEEAYVYSDKLGFNISEHYTDAVWENTRMNNISQHFSTVWLEKYLKNNNEMDKYLDLVPNSNQGIWSRDENGQPKAKHNYWLGFENRTAKGLRFEKLEKGQ